MAKEYITNLLDNSEITNELKEAILLCFFQEVILLMK